MYIFLFSYIIKLVLSIEEKDYFYKPIYYGVFIIFTLVLILTFNLFYNIGKEKD